MAIIEIIKNRKYKIVVPVSYDGDKRHSISRTYACGIKEAKIKESQLKIQIQNGTFIEKNNLTVKEFFEEWIKFQKEKWAPKTYESNLHWCDIIIKGIGHIKLKNINVRVLEEFYSKLKNETNYSDKTIQHFYTLISTALSKAVDWEYISNNPNKKIEKPKIKKKEKNFYNRDEIQKLLEALKDEPIKYQAIILLALDSGARRGELTGLTWEDIDFKNSSININKATQYTKEMGIFEKSTKSETSNRVVYISENTLKILKMYQTEQLKRKMQLGNKWEGSKRVFTSEMGGEMHPDTPSLIFRKIIKRHNLKKICFHELRHTSISLLISLGVPLQQISRRAGHSSVSITDEIYSHIFEEDKIKTANKINDVLKMNVM